MAETLRDRLREIDSEKDRWFRERASQAARLTQDLENAGRNAWNAATRAGVDLDARTPQELQALGARVMNSSRQPSNDARGPMASQKGDRHASSSARRRGPRLGLYEQGQLDSPAAAIREGALQADTAVRSAANLVTFGGADHLAAAADAVLQPNSLGGFRQRYDANLAAERARNAYDAAHRPKAQAIGRLGGTALGLVGMAPVKGAALLATRLPGAVSLSAREGATLLGVGAAGGAASQAVGDAVGGRRSSARDMGGAAIGGAAGVASLPLGPARAGAIDGWVTSAAQDVLNRRPVSLERAGESSITGGVLGGVAGHAGRNVSDNLPISAKGRLGQAMGEARSALNGERREFAPKSRDYLPDGRYWYPDGRSGSVRFEDKFGYTAELSPNQKVAQATLGSDFKLYHFTPEDIARLSSIPGAAFGRQLGFMPDSRP